MQQRLGEKCNTRLGKCLANAFMPLNYFTLCHKVTAIIYFLWWTNTNNLFGGNQIIHCCKIPDVWHAFVIQSSLRQYFVSCNYSLVTVHGYYKTGFVSFYPLSFAKLLKLRQNGWRVFGHIIFQVMSSILWPGF